MRVGERGWIPAFTGGMTQWIPAFAGMTCGWEGARGVDGWVIVRDWFWAVLVPSVPSGQAQ